MSVFSVITAREGSGGLKGKCLRKINGKRVFEYSVEYSMELSYKIKEGVFTVVSSDSETIKKYCLENNIHFIEREPELASDTARIEDVIYDAYGRTGKDFEYISLLYGNIPTRYPEEFFKAYRFLLENKDYDCVLSMQNVEKFNPDWMFELDENILPAKESNGYRRQDLRQLMIHDGHTILFRTRHFLESFIKTNCKENIVYAAFGKKIKPMLNDKLIIDVDTERDLEVTEAVLK